jgi:hypothetical protein
MPRRKRRFDKHSQRLGCEVDWGRGRHRKSDSIDTQRWEAEHLIPERPGWLDSETYVKLAELRQTL